MKTLLTVLLVFLIATSTWAQAIPKTGWKLKFVDSQEVTAENGAATNSFDSKPATFWHTGYSGATTPPTPHEIQVDLGADYTVTGFSYLPRQDSQNGRIGQYEFYVSTDGTAWGSAVISGIFANDATEKQITFAAKPGRYVRLKAVSEVNGKPWTAVAEIGVFGSLVPVGPTVITKLRFEWQQPGEAPFIVENLASHGLWQKESESGEFRKILDIPFNGTVIETYGADQSFTMTGLPNTTVRAWFAVDALNKNGIRTEKSNEVFYDFVIPEMPTVDGPINLKVLVIIEPK